jgi:serine O-acetyltransferase
MRERINKVIFSSIIRTILKYGIDNANCHVLNFIFSDLFRYTGRSDKKLLINEAISNPGFRFSIFMRLCESKPSSIFRKRIHAFSFYFHKRYFFKYGFQIPITTKIGKGFQILHFGNIIFTPLCKIGNNCTVFQGVTIGQDKQGLAPVIGNNVWIGPNSIIVGNINIGNNVLIAPGSYINFNVPDNCLVIGNPGKSFIKTEKIIDGYLLNKV